MSYLVLARKYRPTDFKSVSGQEHVTKTLANAIRRNKVPHAVLLTGPRGVGKTSIARIFAKSLNCVNGPTPEPCLTCSNCLEIANGTSLAVQEIDGASHNSVDNVRELIETFRGVPAPGYRYKIYIIDEVHMLSVAAFNALLKSLEEPPPHTVFILATTEVHRIPDTVISRCQRHDLRALSLSQIREQLSQIVKSEKIAIDEGAIALIARLADGSMRDAQSLLDRVHSFCDGRITSEEASQALGVVERRSLVQISDAIFKRDAESALAVLSGVFSIGLDTSVFSREFALYWRELLVAKFGGATGLGQLGVVDEDAVELRRLVEGQSNVDLQDLVVMAREGCDMAMRSTQPRFALEALVVRMACRERTQDLATLIAGLGGLRHSGAQGVSPAIKTSSSKVNSPVAMQQNSVKNAAVSVSAVVAPQNTSNVSALKEDPGVTLDWISFVKFVSDNTSKMLAEHVKRLECVSFTLGTLRARGPEFSVKSLEKGDYQAKILAVLKDFSQHASWRVILDKTEERELSGSVAGQEKQDRIETVTGKKRSLSDHPHIKRLQEAFPGSSIEDIKIKD